MAVCRRIELFGGLRVIDGDRAITHFITRKTAALLGHLAFHRGRVELRDALIEMLWPWANPASGRRSLSTSLSSLRHLLEPLGVSYGSVLIADRHGVRLNPETTATDVADFEATLARAAAAKEPLPRAERLAAAAALYRGELLSGLGESWIAPEAARLADRFAGAVEELAAILIRHGDREAAAVHLRHAVEAAPLREEPYRQLMLLLAERGEHAAALELYANLAVLLREELGERPSPIVQQLAGQIEIATRATPPIGGTPATARAPMPVQKRGVVPIPAGTVTLLAMRTAGDAAAHADPDTLTAELRRHRGVEVEVSADGTRIAAFSRAGDALDCAVAFQLGGAGSHPASAVHTAEVAIGSAGTYDPAVFEYPRALLAAANPAQILCSAATAGLVTHDLSGGLHLRELGTYRLAHAEIPDHLFEIDYPGGPRGLPPLGVDPEPRSELPVWFTRFIGRRSEIQRITTLLAGPARLVTLTGPPGCGKTRLAVEVGRRCLRDLAGRVWFVPLSDLTEGGDILDRTLEALGIARSPHAAPLDQIAAVLAEAPALIVFDNFEHLLAGAHLLDRFLAQLPAARCLVTSRRRLALPAETSFRVDPLPTPRRGDPAARLENESVRLFADRAHAVAAEFRIEEHLDAVSDICRMLDGLPFAIELAAARLNVLTPGQLRDRLGRLDLLRTRNQEEDPRHRTARAAIAWSHDLLSPPLQRFFAELAVFRGGWTDSAAEAVCNEPLARDYLSELVEWSMVLTRPRTGERTAATATAGTRFWMYASIHEYAREKIEELGSAYRREVEARHGRWFARFGTEDALAELDRHGGIEVQIERTRDLPNMIAACRRAIARGDGDTAVDTFLAAWSVLELRGPFSTAIELGRRLLDMPIGDGLRARALRAIGTAELRSGNLERARGRLESALPLAMAAGDRHSEMLIRVHLGSIEREQGRAAESQAHLDTALAIAREKRDRRGEGYVLGALGNLCLQEGRRDDARSFFTAALAIHREVGNRRLEAIWLGNLGSVHRDEGRMDEARACFETALAIDREIGNRRVEGVALRNLAGIHRVQGRLTEAAACYDAALAIARELGDRRSTLHILNGRGNLERTRSRMEDALSDYTAAMAIAVELGDQRMLGQILSNLGIVHQALGRMDDARDVLERALQVTRATGVRRAEGMALNNLGLLYEELDRLPEAEECFTNALAIARALHERRFEGHVLSNMGGVHEHKGQEEEARACYEEALRIACDQDNRDTAGIILGNLSALSRKQGRTAEARAHIARGEEFLRGVGDLLELAKALCIRADLALDSGDRAEAAAALREAEDLVERTGIGPEAPLRRQIAHRYAALAGPAGPAGAPDAGGGRPRPLS